MRERMRRKQRQIRRRKLMKLATYAVAAVLVMIFVIRGVILPIVHRIGGRDAGETVEVQAQTAAADPNAAIRQPLKGQGDVGKVSALTPGWHEDDSGRWYQNADGTYFAGGLQKIDGTLYSFDDGGYIQTGWVSRGVQDYYFNEDGTYNPEKKRPLLALTFDDGPGQYTEALLDCLEENNSRATFFMLGENVVNYPEAVKRMADLGCEIGSHSWDHPNLVQDLDLDGVAKQFADTDNALIQAGGHAATVARAPFGEWSDDIIATVGKPFFMWSLDSLDWKYKDVDLDYNEIMNGDLSDGTVILMHDIHEASVEAAKRIIPELVAKGYKLVTVSEMAEAKGVTLKNASYSDFWDSSFEAGRIPGAPSTDSGDGTEESTEEDASDALSDGGDGLGDGSDGENEEGEASGELTDGSEG